MDDDWVLSWICFIFGCKHHCTDITFCWIFWRFDFCNLSISPFCYWNILDNVGSWGKLKLESRSSKNMAKDLKMADLEIASCVVDNQTVIAFMSIGSGQKLSKAKILLTQLKSINKFSTPIVFIGIFPNTNHAKVHDEIFWIATTMIYGQLLTHEKSRKFLIFLTFLDTFFQDWLYLSGPLTFSLKPLLLDRDPIFMNIFIKKWKWINIWIFLRLLFHIIKYPSKSA